MLKPDSKVLEVSASCNRTPHHNLRASSMLLRTSVLHVTSGTCKASSRHVACICFLAWGFMASWGLRVTGCCQKLLPSTSWPSPLIHDLPNAATPQRFRALCWPRHLRQLFMLQHAASGSSGSSRTWLRGHVRRSTHGVSGSLSRRWQR